MHKVAYVLIIGLGFTVVVVWLVSLAGRVGEAEQNLSTSQAQSQALADQVEALGGEPVVDPEAPPADEPALIPGPPGEDGLPGLPGLDGLNGTDGKDGRNGQDGADSTTVGPRGPRGETGLSCVDDLGLAACRGPQGPVGATGAPGADSTVPGPQGPQGPAGPAGTANPGTYTCPDGEVAQGFTIGEAGGVTLLCVPNAVIASE
ncbi:hypothetical protein [Nocardioides kribbensis]|uniref:Collagen-like protein n=1 Tax=Nocardioides kribbensis TaxID=305517 RepID=A0ABV1NZ05_9ACTN